HVQQAQGSILFPQAGEFLWRNKNSSILGVAAGDVFDHFRHIEVVITPAELLEGFARLKAATAATPDMITTKKRPLRSGKKLEHLLHRALRANGWRGLGHGAKNFWICPSTSTKRSISSVVL